MNSIQQIVFRHDPTSSDPWNAYEAASEYCRAKGWSVGIMQRGAPTAVFEGECSISKWRNLSSREQADVLATIRSSDGGTFRNSDVILRIVRAPLAKTEGVAA